MATQSQNMFRGVYAVVPTPLLEDEELDSACLRHLIDYYIESGCHGLLILGSAGEFPYFSYAEKIKIVKDAIAAVKGRVPLLVGAGFSSFVETTSFIKEMGGMQVDGVLVITPTFFPVGFDDVYKFYSQICQESPKPILYYNYPQMTQLFFSPEQISRLLSLRGMAGIKDSILNTKEMGRHLKPVRNRNMAFFAGNAFAMQKVLDMGGAGVIEVTSSFAPRLVVDCYNAYIEKDFNRVKIRQDQILNLIPILSSFSPSAGIQKRMVKIISSLPITMKGRNTSRAAVVKETLRQLGHPITAKVRSPQLQITAVEKEAIQSVIRRNCLEM